MSRVAFDVLREHFDRPDRRETPEQIAHNAIAVLLNLPVEERMEAMGMEETWFDTTGDPERAWMEALNG